MEPVPEECIIVLFVKSQGALVSGNHAVGVFCGLILNSSAVKGALFLLKLCYLLMRSNDIQCVSDQFTSLLGKIYFRLLEIGLQLKRLSIAANTQERVIS